MVVVVEEAESRKRSVWQINVVTRVCSEFFIEIDGKVIGVWKGNFVVLVKDLKTDNVSWTMKL